MRGMLVATRRERACSIVARRRRSAPLVEYMLHEEIVLKDGNKKEVVASRRNQAGKVYYQFALKALATDHENYKSTRNSGNRCTTLIMTWDRVDPVIVETGGEVKSLVWDRLEDLINQYTDIVKEKRGARLGKQFLHLLPFIRLPPVYKNRKEERTVGAMGVMGDVPAPLLSQVEVDMMNTLIEKLWFDLDTTRMRVPAVMALLHRFGLEVDPSRQTEMESYRARIKKEEELLMKEENPGADFVNIGDDDDPNEDELPEYVPKRERIKKER